MVKWLGLSCLSVSLPLWVRVRIQYPQNNFCLSFWHECVVHFVLCCQCGLARPGVPKTQEQKPHACHLPLMMLVCNLLSFLMFDSCLPPLIFHVEIIMPPSPSQPEIDLSIFHSGEMCSDLQSYTASMSSLAVVPQMLWHLKVTFRRYYCSGRNFLADWSWKCCGW